MKHKKVMFVMVMVLILSGCIGTSATRKNSGEYTVVGGYPYKAVVFDVKEAGALGVVSLPFDIVYDTIAMPVDLIAWMFGCERSYNMFTIYHGETPK